MLVWCISRAALHFSSYALRLSFSDGSVSYSNLNRGAICSMHSRDVHRLTHGTQKAAHHLLKSGQHTAQKIGEPVVKKAVSIVGSKPVADFIKLVGRSNTAKSVGLVGGEVSAAATEGLGVGGSVEVGEALRPTGAVKVVQELGPSETAKLVKKLAVDNTNEAVAKAKEGLQDSKGALQGLSSRLVWCVSFVWFGLVMVTENIMQLLLWHC